MAITYRPLEEGDFRAVRDLLASNGWTTRVENEQRFKAMLEGADRTIVALDDDRVVGFARALCDGASNGYISTVVVSPDRRGSGIGRTMAQQLMHDDEDRITWVLRSARESRGFWERLGFTTSEVAMERVRRE